MFRRQLLCLNVSEYALCVDLVLLYIGTLLYHVSDVFNKVVLHNVIWKIKGDIKKFFRFIYLLFTFLFCGLRPCPNHLCSKISVNNPSLLFSERKTTIERPTTIWSVTMNCAVECSQSRFY